MNNGIAYCPMRMITDKNNHVINVRMNNMTSPIIRNKPSWCACEINIGAHNMKNINLMSDFPKVYTFTVIMAKPHKENHSDPVYN